MTATSRPAGRNGWATASSRADSESFAVEARSDATMLIASSAPATSSPSQPRVISARLSNADPSASPAMPAAHSTKVGACRRGWRSCVCVSEGKKVCSVPTIAVPNQPPRFSARCAPSRLPCVQAVPRAISTPSSAPTPSDAALASYQRSAQRACCSERRSIRTSAAANSTSPVPTSAPPASTSPVVAVG